jgi:imidazole glycerol phosphate synthase subunit HisF
VAHFERGVPRQAGVDAALAASVFHSGAMLRIPDLKRGAARGGDRGAT